MGEIVITGLASNDPVPGSYLDVLFAQGDAAGSSSDYAILLLGNKTSAGSATADTVIYGPDTDVQCQTQTDVTALFGAGSELDRMYRRVVAVNQSTSIYFVAISEGATPTAATRSFVVATTATANGTARVFCGDSFVDTSVVTGDTAATIATNIVANINSKTEWPITAAVSSSTHVDISAKNAGPRGNWIRVGNQVIGASMGTTITNGADAFLTSGATADSNTTALATILSRRFYYIVSAAEDATQLGNLSSQINTMAAPIVGMRQRFFAGSVDTLANTITIATGLNAARGTVTWHKYGPLTPAELAANQAAIEALYENTAVPRCNFAGFGNDAATQPYWRVNASRTSTAAPTRTDIKSALNNGISPIGVNTNGSTYLVNRVTTRSLSGSVVDYRVRDSHKVTICDRFADDLNAKNVLNFAGALIANDPPKGAQPVQAPPGVKVVTPSVYRSTVFGLLNVYDGNALLQNIATIKADTAVQRSASPTTRMTARIPLQPIDCLFQIGVVVAQVA